MNHEIAKQSCQTKKKDYSIRSRIHMVAFIQTIAAEAMRRGTRSTALIQLRIMWHVALAL
jgi:hypothetical protein